MSVNNQAKILNRAFIVKEIEEKLYNNYQLIHDQMIRAISKPFGEANFVGVNFKKFFSIFWRADNKKKSKMVLLFTILYEPRYGNNSVDDLLFVKGLYKEIERKFSGKLPQNISGALTNDLLKAVSKSIDVIQPYHSVS